MIGGITRVGKVAATVVPLMCVLYLLGGAVVVIDHWGRVPQMLVAIVVGAFDPSAGLGGAAGIAFREVLVTGVKRAVFSNEAGVGTEAMAHGAARTSEPVREGLVAMLGPVIDTHIVCTIRPYTVSMMLTEIFGVTVANSGRVPR